MDKWPKVAIIVLNWNGWRDTIECLESVLRNDYPNYQVIVVDNNSPNNSMEYIKVWAEGRQEVLTPAPSHPLYHLSHPPVKKPIPYVYYTREEAESGGGPELEEKLKDKIPEGVTTKYPLVFIQTGENLGFAGGNNVGIRYALAKDNFEYIWLLNNDTVIDKSALSEMVKLIESNSKIGVVGSKLLFYDKPNTIQAIGGGKINKWTKVPEPIGRLESDNVKRSKKLDLDHIIGASMLIRKKIIEEVGFMDESFFMYLEETDWCIRIKKAGWKLFYCPRSKIWHKEGKTIGNKNPIQDYYIVRNCFYFVTKNYPLYLPVCLLYSIYRFILPKLVRRESKRLKFTMKAYLDFFRNRNGKLVSRSKVNENRC